MHLLPLPGIISAALLILLPVHNSSIWATASFSCILILYLASGNKPGVIIKRNIFILSFIVFFNSFVFFSASISDSAADTESAVIISLRIFLVYNVITAGMSVMGKGGVLCLAEKIRTPSLRLYFLLLTRSVSNLTKDHTHIVRQLKSRIDLRSRDKYLLPRYYTTNLITREIRRYGINQGVLLSRMPDSYKIDFSNYPVSARSVTASVIVTLAAIAGIISQRVSF